MSKKESSPDALHIGKTIRKRLDEIGMTKSEFSRRIGTSPQNVYGIFKRSTIDTEVLKKISGVLDHDFFQYYSDGISADKSAKEMLADLEQAKAELALAKKENEYLKEIVGLMKGKK